MREVRIRSVVLREVEYKVFKKFKDEGGVMAVSMIALTRVLVGKVGVVVSAKGAQTQAGM